MSEPTPAGHRGEYAARGDYHRAPDHDWDYLPTYLAKMARVRAYLDALPPSTPVLDAGCGEGLLVEEYVGRLAIEGLDANYTAPHVRQGSLTALPYADATFARVLCLDVLEHLSYEDQPRALAEIHRVLRPDGEALVSIPNLAHLQSRVHFLLTRPADPHRQRGEAPRGSPRRRTPAAVRARGLPRGGEGWYLPDRSCHHCDDPAAPVRPWVAAPCADAVAAHPRLVLPEPVPAAEGIENPARG